MGQWGFYDDEGDYIADIASEIEHRTLPKHLQECYKLDQEIKVSCKDIESDDDKEKLITKLIKDLGNLLPTKPGVSTWITGDTCLLNFQTIKGVECFAQKKQWLTKHRKQLGEAALSSIAETYIDNNSAIAGIALYLARNWQSTPIFPANQATVNRGFGLPKSLPPAFPDKLRIMALRASKQMLAQFDNASGWSEPEKRIQALKNQIKLFS